jgi:serine/threonine-protein kinase
MALEDQETATSDERSPGSRNHAKLSNERYQVGDRIGRGGMGEVLVAHDAQIGREVVIKRMRAAKPSERQVARFVREARIQGRLEHPAIVPVHELGHDDDGLPFFAMKKLAGTTLAAILDAPDRERFTRQRLLRAFAEVCLAVEYAHVHGVIHRDLKPDNIMLGDFGEVYVLDWGVAKVVGEADELGTDLALPGGTNPGTAMGTPGFMAPEQIRGAPDLDARADVFSLGRVLGMILDCHFDSPPELETLRARATDDTRQTRLATARELGESVQRYLDGDRDLALRSRLAREHFERARGAFDHDEQRAAAMREAGRALALDPQLPGAAELVSRLMLEPPREPPAAVLAAIDRDDRQVHGITARAALCSYPGYLVLVVILLIAGSYGYAALVTAALAVNVVIPLRERSGVFVPTIAVIAAQLPLLALVARLCSPAVAGGLASMTALVIATHPRMRQGLSTAALAVALIVAVISPMVLERLGVLSSSFTFDALGVHLVSPGFGESPVLALAVLATYITVPIFLGAFVGRVTRATERTLRDRLHLQTWQLAQLAPASPV